MHNIISRSLTDPSLIKNASKGSGFRKMVHSSTIIHKSWWFVSRVVRGRLAPFPPLSSPNRQSDSNLSLTTETPRRFDFKPAIEKYSALGRRRQADCSLLIKAVKFKSLVHTLCLSLHCAMSLTYRVLPMSEERRST